MKKFFENLFILPCKFPNWLSRDKTSSTLTTEYTFNKYIPDRSIMLSRMKVRQEPPARKGYYGKQGGYVKQTYEIIAVFKTAVYTGSENEFRYFQFVDAATKEQFDGYIQRAKEKAFYDTKKN